MKYSPWFQAGVAVQAKNRGMLTELLQPVETKTCVLQ
jgi:hypothetical protein